MPLFHRSFYPSHYPSDRVVSIAQSRKSPFPHFGPIVNRHNVLVSIAQSRKSPFPPYRGGRFSLSSKGAFQSLNRANPLSHLESESIMLLICRFQSLNRANPLSHQELKLGLSKIDQEFQSLNRANPLSHAILTILTIIVYMIRFNRSIA